jgi:hypothetical protein
MLNRSRRNPLTQLAHRREVFWQITLPLLVGTLILLVVVAGVIWAAASQAGDVNQWASASIIWMLVFAMFFTLIFLLIIAGLVYAVTWLLGTLPVYTLRLQDLFVIIRFRVEKFSDAVVEPVLRVRQNGAAGREFWRGLKAAIRQILHR